MSYLSKTKQIFANVSLSGDIITELQRNAKNMVHSKLSSFLTDDTIDIMFDACECEAKPLGSKTAEDVGAILFAHPLNKLLSRIQNEPINGQQFTESLHHEIIKKETGWSEDEVYQIHSILFRHHTFTQSEFELNMNHVLDTKYGAKLSEEIVCTLKEVISQHDVSMIQYKMKNGQKIEAFSHCVINMVDELLQNVDENKHNDRGDVDSDLIQTMYDAIAECFIFGDDYDEMRLKLQRWICNNCSNCNINSVINGESTTKVTMCRLCGMSQ
eukprot:1080426_1